MTPREDLALLAHLAAEQVISAPPLGEAWRRVRALPYGFRPEDGTHVRWAEAERRGYAGCGEAAAFLAASAARDGHRVALELVGGSPSECGYGYRHAVAVVDGVRLDPYAGNACPAPHVSIARRFL